MVCRDVRMLLGCRVTLQYPSQAANGLYGYLRRCAQPVLPMTPLRPLEDIWASYYSGYRTWAAQSVDLSRQSKFMPRFHRRGRGMSNLTAYGVAGPVMIIKYEDMMNVSTAGHVVRQVVLATTGRVLPAASHPMRTVTEASKMHGTSRNLSRAYERYRQCEYLRELPAAVVQRVLTASAHVVALAHSFGYALPCPAL